MIVLNIIGLMLLLAVIGVMFIRSKLVLSPVFPITVMWAISIVLYGAVFEMANPAILLSILLTLLLVTGFIFSGSSPAGAGIPTRTIATPTIEKSLVMLPIVIAGSIVAGLVLNFILLREAGSLSLGLAGILRSAAYYSSLRYGEGVGIPVVVRFLNVLAYSGMAIGSLIFWERLVIARRFSPFLLIPMLLLLFESILIGTKSIAVLCVVYSVSTYLVIVNYYELGIRRKRAAIFVVGTILALFAFVLTVHYLRADGGLSVFSITEKILTSYLWVPFVAFLEWIGSGPSVAMLPDGYGVNVFEGIFAYLSDYHEKIDEMTYVRIGDTTYTTNVYTLFEPVIRDFGILGSFLVIALLGFATGAASCRLRERRISFIGIYIALSGFVLFSFVGSMYKFLTNIVVSLVLVTYFYLSREKVRSIVGAIAAPRGRSGEERSRARSAASSR